MHEPLSRRFSQLQLATRFMSPVEQTWARSMSRRKLLAIRAQCELREKIRWEASSRRGRPWTSRGRRMCRTTLCTSTFGRTASVASFQTAATLRCRRFSSMKREHSSSTTCTENRFARLVSTRARFASTLRVRLSIPDDR